MDAQVFWGEDRKKWYSEYNPNTNFLHPFPWNDVKVDEFLKTKWKPPSMSEAP